MCLQTLRVGMDLITKPVFNHRSTKIIATIGHQSGAQEQLLGLLDSGVNVVRLDLGDEHALVGSELLHYREYTYSLCTVLERPTLNIC